MLRRCVAASAAVLVLLAIAAYFSRSWILFQLLQQHPVGARHAFEWRGTRTGFPEKDVEIVLDGRGVPHIFGRSESDLAFALAFMHARDRLFQIELLRHAAWGRLSELFGADLLDDDRELRLASFDIERQFAELSAEDHALLVSYAEGVNAGAREAGTPIELRLLGVSFEPFRALDALAVARLQAWTLAQDAREELARARILAHLPPGSPLGAIFVGPVSSGGVPIMPRTAAEHGALKSATPVGGGKHGALKSATPVGGGKHGALKSGAPVGAGKPGALKSGAPVGAGAPPPSATGPSLRKDEPLPGAPPPPARLGLPGGGSNSWVVRIGGRAMLFNDPHLAHQIPSLFYLVHLEHPDFSLTGASVPGMPAVVIGHGRHVAWGLTVSYADMQDTIRIAPASGQADAYLLDGKPVPFGRSMQQFRLGHGAQATVKSEEWRTTVFGPVLPPSFAGSADPYALAWSGYALGGVHARAFSGFWSLGRARDLADASVAIAQLNLAGQSVVLALTDGTIAYRLAAAVPLRRSAESTHLPRDGRYARAGWSGFLRETDKPALTNPPSGFIVAANQRIVADGAPAAKSIGVLAASPYRAKRISTRLAELLAAGKRTLEDFLAVQQDTTSTEALDLVPALQQQCPDGVAGHSAVQLAALCRAIQHFDGNYTVDSIDALPFTRFIEELRLSVLEAHFDRAMALDLYRRDFVKVAINEALTAEHAGHASPLFDDPRSRRHGLAPFVAVAAARALDWLVAKAGADPTRWRWGKLHTLQFRSPLADAPLIGGLFQTDAKEEPGYNESPRAEAGLPVRAGAVLRFAAEMTTPPTVRLGLDLGNSGQIDTLHFADQARAWKEGRPERMPADRPELERQASGHIVLRALAPSTLGP